jgi:hypothetical protein
LSASITGAGAFLIGDTTFSAFVVEAILISTDDHDAIRGCVSRTRCYVCFEVHSVRNCEAVMGMQGRFDTSDGVVRKCLLVSCLRRTSKSLWNPLP